LLLAIPLSQDRDAEPKAPSKERVEAAVSALTEAFDSYDKEQPAPTVGAIQSAADVPAKEVVSVLAKRGLRHENREVAMASIQALGMLDHPAALKQLHSLSKRDRKKLAKDPDLSVAVVKAIARHGNPDSIPYLIKDIFQAKDPAIARARIVGLAGIRSERSVEELFGLMRGAARNKIQPYMRDFWLALVVLTAVDQGMSQDLWMSWWGDNKKTLKVGAKPPVLPEELQRRWDSYWGNRRTYKRQKRRGERGDDPERDDG
jgi:hypothetical protein